MPSRYLRRRTGRNDYSTVVFASFYALGGFSIAYNWNVMWLDGVALLPLVVLGLEHMLHTGRFLPYALLLALALYANYYIGFMLCLFLVLYFLQWLLRHPRSAGALTRACGRFAGASLLAGGLAAFLLVPTALALSRTSAAGGTMPSFDSNFPLFELLGRMFYGASPTIRSGNLPNVYCGVIAVLLLPVSAIVAGFFCTAWLTQSLLPTLAFCLLSLVLCRACGMAPMDCRVGCITYLLVIVATGRYSNTVYALWRFFSSLVGCLLAAGVSGLFHLGRRS